MPSTSFSYWLHLHFDGVAKLVNYPYLFLRLKNAMVYEYPVILSILSVSCKTSKLITTKALLVSFQV